MFCCSEARRVRAEVSAAVARDVVDSAMADLLWGGRRVDLTGNAATGGSCWGEGGGMGGSRGAVREGAATIFITADKE